MNFIFKILFTLFIGSTAYTHPSIHAQDTLAHRLDYFSQQSLNKPYILFPLGEGKHGKYDQYPRYRVDGFDCLTFVETTLALSFANNNTHQFKQWMDRIRYKEGKVSFITRNHFTAIDWNTNGHIQGFLKDITPNLVDEHKQAVVLYSKTLINKGAWFRHLPLSRIRLIPPNQSEAKKRLALLKKRAYAFKPVISELSYIPFSAWFNTTGEANMALFKQIPNGSIIEIVRPNWDLTDMIGTQLDVSHLGFVFWKKNSPWFREASSIEHKVIDIPLIAYLKEASTHPSIKGIHIEYPIK